MSWPYYGGNHGPYVPQHFIPHVMVDDLEETQDPIFYRYGVPKNFAVVCDLCGKVWMRVYYFGTEGRVPFWEARTARCHECGMYHLAGSILQFQCKWRDVSQPTNAQGIGPKLALREADLVLQQQ